MKICLAFACIALVVLSAGCAKEPEPQSIEMVFRGTPGVRVRGFWVSKGTRKIPERKTELSVMVPDVIKDEALGVKFFHVRKLTDDGFLRVFIHVGEETILDKEISGAEKEIFHPIPDRLKRKKR